jgi:hypothetical protein
MNTLEAFGFFMAGVIASAVVAILLTDTLEILAAATLGRFLRFGAADLRGTWRSTYTYPHENAVYEAEQLMKLKQNGKFIHAAHVAGAGPHKHAIRLKLEGEYLTGTWQNVSRGAAHKGALQLRVNPNGDRMVGRWIGFDSSGMVQGGEWKWTRA